MEGISPWNICFWNCLNDLPNVDAEIEEEDKVKIQSLTKEIYGILGMKGIVRMDYIIKDGGNPFLIEINSVPGMSKESIVPQMANALKIKLSSILI